MKPILFSLFTIFVLSACEEKSKAKQSKTKQNTNLSVESINRKYLPKMGVVKDGAFVVSEPVTITKVLGRDIPVNFSKKNYSLYLKGQYALNQRVGKWELWKKYEHDKQNTDYKLHSHFTFKKNKLNGKFLQLFKNGQPSKTTNYKDGFRIGEAKEWYSPEQLAGEYVYGEHLEKKGVLLSEKTWHKNKQKKSTLDFQNDKFIEKTWFKNGNQKGENIFYYFVSAKYNYLKKNYLSRKDWTRNGNLRRFDNYNFAGYKHGVSEKYSLDGKTRTSYIYVHDILVEEKKYDKKGALLSTNKRNYVKLENLELKEYYDSKKTKIQKISQLDENGFCKSSISYYKTGEKHITALFKGRNLLEKKYFDKAGVVTQLETYPNNKSYTSSKVEWKIKNGSKVKIEQFYKGNELAGIWKETDANGKILRQTVYKDGVEVESFWLNKDGTKQSNNHYDSIDKSIHKR